MSWLFSRANVRALKAAVAANDVPAALGLLSIPGLARRATGGEDCALRAALRNENPEMVGLLLRAGARPTPDTGAHMALWVERAQRVARLQPCSHAASRAQDGARQAIAHLLAANTYWEGTSPSLGNGDSAAFVINHAWPGTIPATGA